MAWLLFVDESGHDLRKSPYEVLAGVAIADERIWNLITAIHQAEERFFGMRITAREMEIKAKRLLKRKTFRLAGQMPPIEPSQRTVWARECLEEGRRAREARDLARPRRHQLTALGQAKIAFVERALELCAQHGARAFASIVDRDAPRTDGHFLRKDYAYLFERFYYFLDELPPHQHGLVVFDELERSQSHLLVEQMDGYFEQTVKGRMRASRILPEPLFVHSDLTSLIQVADLVAYITAWGIRVDQMHRPRRHELSSLASRVCNLRHRAVRERGGETFYIWSFAVIDDLRSREEHDLDES